MTAPMTPRDPFTDEARELVRIVKLTVGSLAVDTVAGALQGTWNEAIKAAAKYHDLAASIAEQRKVEAIAQGDAIHAAHYRREIVEHEQHARCIRALKRPEAP